jgi:pilus assembly protein CpaE
VTSTISASIVGSRDRQLEELLQACGVHATPIKADDLGTLAQPGGSQPNVVILDLRDRSAVPPAVGMIRRQHPSTGVIIVAAAHEPALMLEAMRSGVTEFLTVPLTAADLQAALARVTAQSAPISKGRVFAFLGAKGGVGTTTVAVNVATAMAQLDPGSTLLIDLHLAYGDAAVFLGTEPRFSVVDALENVQRLDKAFFSGLVGQARAGLALLASSDRAAATPVDALRVRSLIDAAAQHYTHVLLDVPRSEVMLDALESASRIIIVANQELATVRAATRLSASLRQRYGKDRLSVVISRFDQHSEIGQSDVERVLGSKVAHTFPSNYRVALEGLNMGRPVVLDNHNKLAASLTGFARGLVDVDEEPEAPRRQAGLLGRFKGRRA